MRKRKTLWHNYRSFQSDKIQVLISQHGIGYYGFYWLLMEIAARQGMEIRKNKFFALSLARDLDIDVQRVEEIMKVMKDCELFGENDICFFPIEDDTIYRWI